MTDRAQRIEYHRVFGEVVREIALVFRYVSDERRFGVTEYHTLLSEPDEHGHRTGDCEDWVNSVALECVERGLPRWVLFKHYCIVRHRDGRREGHLALECLGLYADCNAREPWRPRQRPETALLSRRRLDLRTPEPVATTQRSV